MSNINIGVHKHFVVNENADTETRDYLSVGQRVEFVGFILHGPDSEFLDANFRTADGDEWLMGLYEVSPLLDITG